MDKKIIEDLTKEECIFIFNVLNSMKFTTENLESGILARDILLKIASKAGVKVKDERNKS